MPAAPRRCRHEVVPVRVPLTGLPCRFSFVSPSFAECVVMFSQALSDTRWFLSG